MSTQEKKQAFLDNYKKFKYITKTCNAVGVSYSKYYEWLGDETFSKESSAIKKELDSDRLESYEAELDKRALFGSKQSDILLMFGLKALKPGVYREKVAGPLIAGDIKIVMAIPGYDESLRLKDGNTINLKEGDYAIQGQGSQEEARQGRQEEETRDDIEGRHDRDDS